MSTNIMHAPILGAPSKASTPLLFAALVLIVALVAVTIVIPEIGICTAGAILLGMFFAPLLPAP